MIIDRFDTSEKVFLVAEIGNNHEGDFSLAKRMVERAALTGVDAVKFQTFIPELFISPSDSERLERLRRFKLSFKQFEQLSTLARECGLIFLSTPLDLESADFLNSIQSVFKIASGDNNFHALIERVLSFKKPLLISTGLACIADTDLLFDFCNERASVDTICFLHCVSSYPTPLHDANLRAITTLSTRYRGLTIGYSDHTLGFQAALCSVALGARVLEKHFTLDKNQSPFRDHQLSASPQELAQLVQLVREVESLLGTGEKRIQNCELPLVIEARRSIVASKSLPVGHVLSSSDLKWVRPGSGLPPNSEVSLIGKTLSRGVREGEMLTLEDVS